MQNINTQKLYLIGFLTCLMMMVYALYAEHQLLLTPCPLCVLQRLAVTITGVLFLIAALHNPKSIKRYIYSALILGSSLSGVGVAGWHVYLQNLPIDKVPSCGPGFDYLIGNFPLSDALLLIFSGSGECALIDWSFMMLSMPTWVVIFCLGLAALNIFASIISDNK
ncbi:MAG: disulfide bond formation protein B [Woeseiaceae bacterium]|nr:disulfide bond formation protein B [Woeseiaceae bacterium]